MAAILLVDDEPALLQTISYALRRDGHEVATATDGRRALEAARRAPPDLVLLDVMLPGSDGLEVCRALRRDTSPALRSVPVLMLSARTEETDRVVGLEVGADDYVTKPFSVRELLARVKALLHRSKRSTEAAAAGVTTDPIVADPSGELELDLPGRRLWCRGKEVPLKPREFDLLAFLLRHPGQVFTREQLLDRVWAQSAGTYVGDIRTVDVHIRWLREKIERDPSKPKLLETMRGVGYRLRAPAAPPSPASRPAVRA